MLHGFSPGIISAQASAYLLEQSLLFDGASYLSRTPSVAGNRKTWTFSCWVKIGEVPSGLAQQLLSANTDTNNRTDIFISGTGELYLQNYVGGVWVTRLATSAKFLDPSAWYHFNFFYDSTPATPGTSDIGIEVNGTKITDFSIETYPSQNSDTQINNTVFHTIGRYSFSAVNFFDGLMALPQLVDGAALAPTAFGETDADDFWNPIKYTGSFGTNGFQLDFADTTLFGKDVSSTRTALTANYVTSVSNDGGGGFATSPVTFSSVDIGTASATRKVIVGVGIDGYQGNEAYTSLTIGGVAANLVGVQNAASGGRPVALYELDVSSGTSADIVVTFTGTQTKCYSMAIGVWTIEGGTLFSTVGSTADPGAGNISVSSGGTVIAIMTEGNANATYTWANLTENFDNQVRSGRQAFSGASKNLSSATTQAISANVSGGSQFAMLAASFAPANDYLSNNFVAADQLEDTPTDSSDDGIGNFSTLNPNFKQGTAALSEGNLKIASSSGFGGFAGTVGMDSGKYYWEQSHVGTVAGNFNMGVCRAGVGTSTSITGNAFVAVYEAANNFRANGSNSGNFTPSVTTDCIIGWAYDADARKLWMAVDNTFVNLASAGTGNPATGANPTATISGTDAVFAIGQIYNASGSKYAEYNFGQKAFAYTPPTGFVALATQNLPDTHPLYTGTAAQYRAGAQVQSDALGSNSTGGANQSMRVVIPASAIADQSATRVRLKLKAASSQAFDTSHLYFGTNATGGSNAWDFTGDQVQVSVNGSTTISVAAGTSVYSDWFTFACDGTDPLCAAWLFAATGGGTAHATTSGYTRYYKVSGTSSTDASATSPSGFTAQSNYFMLIAAIEVQ